MSRPDVSIISPYPSLAGSHHAGASGVASYTANLARSLRDEGAAVHVVAPSADPDRLPDGGGAEQDGPGIAVQRVAAGRTGLKAATRAVLDGGAPVGHLQFELFLYGGPTALGGVLGALGGLRRQGLPTVVTLHQTVDPSTVDRAYRTMHRVPVPAPVARMGIASVQNALRSVASTLVVHEEPFRHVVPDAAVIPHGIERVTPADRRAARRRLDLDDRLVALCFGFLAPYKGLETALEAGERAGRDVLVVVAGGPHPRLVADGDDYGEELRRRHGHRARFTGWVPGEDVVAWFSAADVALFPYPKPFSSSGALALALACGTPTLLSSPMARCVGAPSQMVAATVDELADRLRTLAAVPAARDELRVWTTCLAEGRSWDEVAGRHLALYRDVAGRDVADREAIG